MRRYSAQGCWGERNLGHGYEGPLRRNEGLSRGAGARFTRLLGRPQSWSSACAQVFVANAYLLPGRSPVGPQPQAPGLLPSGP